jgi:hypothetical protein
MKKQRCMEDRATPVTMRTKTSKEGKVKKKKIKATGRRRLMKSESLQGRRIALFLLSNASKGSHQSNSLQAGRCGYL